MTLLGVSDVTQNGGRKKHEEYVIKQSDRQAFLFKKWLDHIVLKRSYLITVATDFNQTLP